MVGDGCCFKLFVAFLMLLLPFFQHTSLSLAVVLGHDDADADVPTVRCPEREREALLAFKQGLVDTRNTLSSWGFKQDCCTWEGVFCSNQTGNVIKLDLVGYYGYAHYLEGKMISPKLIELKHLKYMDLMDINFNGSQIPDFIGSLSNLIHLDLSWTYFGGRFPYQIANLTHLQYLDLSGNQFTHVENLNWLTHLSSLTYLDLSYTNLSTVFGWLEAVNKLPKLTNLTLFNCDLPPPKLLSTLSSINSSKSLASVDLSGNSLSSWIFTWLSNYKTSLVDLRLYENSLTGSIPDGLGNMSSLASLDLSYNQLEGADSLSFSKLCNLQTLDLSDNNLSLQFSKLVQMLLSTCADKTSLENLYLSDNHLAGSVPNLTGFSSLKDLYLSNNSLRGGIPESIGQMSNLVSMDLRMNSLKGVISDTHFSKLSKLQALWLSSNFLVLDINPDWVPPFQLEVLKLKSCKIGPNFPKWLQTQKHLFSLDLSDAGIYGILPSWFRGLFPNVTFMDLSHNQIEGPIPLIPAESLYHLDLSNNKFSGSITFLCASATTSLAFLNLSSNNFSGELPDCLTDLEYLVMLDLSYNSFYGKIPKTIGSLFRMETLKLRRNGLVGELTSSLKNCSSLKVIDLGYNTLSGPIPTWLGTSLENLVILLLSSNQFNGSIPSELCHLSQLRILDVFENNISGSIPKCLNNLTALAHEGNSNLTVKHDTIIYFGQSPGRQIDYEDDAIFVWKGRMQSYKSTLGLVKRIDFSNNRLTGEIPSEITRLVGLVSLNLSRNHLTGHIPQEIGNLKSLDSLDLARNQIDGRIPTSLAQIDRLAILDLSWNNLSGKIPTGTQLQGFNSSVYAENPQLCGPPLQKKCDWEETTPKKPEFIDEEDQDEHIRQGFYISMVLGFVVGFWGVCGSLICIRSWRYSYFRFLNAFNDWFYVRFMLIRRSWMLKR